MYSFRALVRRLLGVSLPSETVASEVASLKEEVASLKQSLSTSQLSLLISDIRYDIAEDSALDAIFTLLNGIGLSGVTVEGEDEAGYLEGYDSDVDCG